MSQDASLPELLRIPTEPEESQSLLPLAGGSSDDIDEPDDDDFAPPPPRGRASKPTIALATLAVLALGFLGGALVQKHEGASSTSPLAARAGRFRGAGGAAGFAGLGEGGVGAAGTGAGAAAAAGTGTAAGTGAATTATAPGPVAIGTVVSVSGTTLVVRDLGGTTHTLTIGGGVTLSTSTPFSAAGLKPGQSVTVDGTTGSGGAVTVTTVVRRS